MVTNHENAFMKWTLVTSLSSGDDVLGLVLTACAHGWPVQ
jgi:hypothetical protein